MTRDDIIRMAREAGSRDFGADSSTHVLNVDVLKRFAALVAAAEREACAQVADDLDCALRCGVGGEVGAAIRARSQP